MPKIDPEITTYILIPTIVLLSATLLVFVVRKAMNIFLASRSSFLKVNPTNYSFLNHSISFFIYIIAIGFIIYTIPELKQLGEGLFAATGILAAILAFASQAAFSNIISGVFIVIFRPFRVEDIIEIEGDIYKGTVEDITLRHTVIRDFQNKRIIIPNSMISNKTIVNNNIGDERLCKHVEIAVAYDTNIDKAINIIQKAAEQHPSVLDVRTPFEIEEGKPKVEVRLIKLEAYSLLIRAWVWCKSPEDSFHVNWDLLKTVKEEFDRNNIEIPFPYHTIVYKSDIEDKKQHHLPDSIKNVNR